MKDGLEGVTGGQVQPGLDQQWTHKFTNRAYNLASRGSLLGRVFPVSIAPVTAGYVAFMGASLGRVGIGDTGVQMSRVEMAAPPCSIILTVGAKTLVLRGSVVCRRSTSSWTATSVLLTPNASVCGDCFAKLQEVKGGLAVSRRKPSPTLRGGRGSHTVRSGQEPHTPGGTEFLCS